MPRLFLLDGHALAFRAFYAIDSALATKDGRPTNAVYGFALMINKLIEQHQPEYIAAAFDRGKPTIRLEKYADYKVQRERMPDELRLQVDYIKEMLLGMGVSIFEVDGHEADDVIGTLTLQAEAVGIDSVVVTSDRDSLQLISPRVKVMLTKKGVTEIELMGEQEVLAKYGLKPHQLIDLKAFMGDASDNIKGVKGIGEKTALALVQQFGSVEDVYERIHEVTRAKLQELLLAGKDDAFLSKYLATIVRDVALGFDLSQFRLRQEDVPRLAKLYRDLELNSMLNKLDLTTSEQKAENREGVTVATTDLFTHEDVAAFVSQTIGENIGLILTPNRELVLSSSRGVVRVAEQLCLQLNPLLHDNCTTKVVCGYKALESTLRSLGLTLGEKVFDAELAAYLLDPTRPSYSISELGEKYLQKSMNDEGAKSSVLRELAVVLTNEMAEKNLLSLYSEVELPLSRVLIEMELCGVTVDKEVLKEMEVATDKRLQSIMQDIYALAGEEFNIASPKQLAFILFERLGLSSIKKTKTGHSTDAEVLEALADQHEIVSKILEYRTLAKLKSTYLEGLQKVIDVGGKIHTTYNQTVTATGRLSSTEPNLQNIPIRLEEGRLIRRAFKPSVGYTHVLAADYSQIELRILAHLSKDPILTEAFRKGEDIHQRTAAEVFGVSPAEVTKEMRDRAKAVNFGIIYGISDYGLSKDIKVPRAEARAYIANYFTRYAGVKTFIDKVVSEARVYGYVTTLLCRRRYLPDINSRNFTLRSFAERTAMNTPIQGTAADLIKLAMVRIHDELRRSMLTSRMILQVHDELIFETTEQELSALKKLVQNTMETALDLSVPLVVDLKVGENWYKVRKIDER